MKKYLIVLGVSMLLAGCTRSEKSEVRNEAEETRARVAEERREYQRKMEERLDRIDREIDEERAKAEGRKMNAKAKREYNERVEELTKLRAETREKYNGLKNSAADGWNSFKSGVDEAVDKLDNSWDRFKADMKS